MIKFGPSKQQVNFCENLWQPKYGKNETLAKENDFTDSMDYHMIIMNNKHIM